MALFSKKKKADEADIDDSLDEEDEEEVLEREQIKQRPKQRIQEEPSPLSKQEVGELIDSNIKRLYELFNFYRQMS